MKILKKLPIDDYRAQICEAVENNAVVIITAETGAGKSTRVPQFLLDEGCSLVVTQPRRLAARSVAKRVAQERNCELGAEVGFRTAHERQDSYETRCLFCTDGLAMVRELMGFGRHQVLVLDEVHEWNLNIEVLAAWAKRQIESGANFKLVIMSATLEAEKLSEFFNSAPVISVPGRCYPVEEKKPTTSERTRQLDLLKDVVDLLQEGRNVLVFEPGKTEISDLASNLEKVTGLDAEILPLHGELEADEQDRIFRSYHRPKCVIATNVAQTSITIEDIDAVVDSGTEKRIELMDGVEGLYLRSISLADRSQRKGRAGRCREGIYIDHCPQDDGRREFPLAEIFRVRLDQTVLRLAEAKIDAEELQFFHQPPLDQIHEAKRALRALGCMNEDGAVTAIGKQVAKLPVSVQYGRMIVEAEKLGVVSDIIDIAAILEQGGVTARKVKISEDYSRDAFDIWPAKFCPKETESNVLAQLAVFQGARNMSNEERRFNGVFVKAYHQVAERRKLLAESLRGKVQTFRSSGRREDILRAVCSGMVDHLYKEYGTYWKNGDDTLRQQSKGEISLDGKWLVGLPFDLEVRGKRGTFMLNLVTMTTKINPEVLIEVAPQLAKIIEGLNPRYEVSKEVCVSTRQIFFNDMLVKEEEVETPNHEKATEVYANYLAKVEAARIEACWSQKRSEFESSSWISKPEEVFPLLSSLFSEVEITKDGDGKAIIAYLSLYSDSDPDFKIRLRTSFEEAQSETRLGLTRLFQKSCKSSLTVPTEEPWVTPSGSNYTELGLALKNRFQNVLSENGEITISNIQSKVEQAKIVAETIKAEIGKDWLVKKELIDSLEELVNQQDCYMIQVEVEKIKTEIKTIKTNSPPRSLMETEAMCASLRTGISELKTLAAAKVELKEKAEESFREVEENLLNLMRNNEPFSHISSNERDQAREIFLGIQKCFSEYRYEEIILKVTEVKELVKSAQEKNQYLLEIIRAEYSICPICGEKMDLGYSHYCDEEYEVELSCYEDGLIKKTLMNGEVLISLFYNEDEQAVNILVNREQLLASSGAKTAIVKQPEPKVAEVTINQIEALKALWGSK